MTTEAEANAAARKFYENRIATLRSDLNTYQQASHDTGLKFERIFTELPVSFQKRVRDAVTAHITARENLVAGEYALAMRERELQSWKGAHPTSEDSRDDDD